MAPIKKNNQYYVQIFLDRFDLFMDMKDFFFTMIMFSIFQIGAYMLAGYA